MLEGRGGRVGGCTLTRRSFCDCSGATAASRNLFSSLPSSLSSRTTAPARRSSWTIPSVPCRSSGTGLQTEVTRPHRLPQYYCSPKMPLSYLSVFFWVSTALFSCLFIITTAGSGSLPRLQNTAGWCEQLSSCA